MSDETPPSAGMDDAPWRPPMWPRYVGIGALVLVLAGCVALVLIGFGAVGDDGGSDVLGVILGVVGFGYVSNELRSALRRLRDTQVGGGVPPQ